MEDLHQIIEDSLTDATLPTETELEAPEAAVADEPAPESTLAENVAPEPANEPTEPVSEASKTEDSPEVKSPTAKGFDLEKHLGPQNAVTGRENRIPYSRVKKITEKAVKEGVDSARQTWEAEYTPKYQELETKVKDYETRFQQVAQFERIMVEQPVQFLERLAALPQYAPIFQALQQQQSAPAAAPEAAPQVVPDDMPPPNQTFPDGSAAYDLDGLKNVLDWHAKKVEERVVKQISDRYAPLESDYKSYQQMQSVIPQVNAQIAEARQWPMFNESEADIVKALQADQNLSLEGAYRQVVFPKLTAERKRMREEIMRELKTAPTSTSVPPRASKPQPLQVHTGTRNLEDIIAEQVQQLK